MSATITEVTPVATPEPLVPARRLPHLATGVRLLGAYEGSGFREDHYLAIRSDGQVVHLSRILFFVLAALLPGRSAEDVARVVSGQLDRQLTADGVFYLLDKKLAPSGLVEAADLGSRVADAAGGEPVPPVRSSAPKANPLLALRLHRTLLSERSTRRLAERLQVLFSPLLIVVTVLCLIAVDMGLIITGAGGDALTAVFREPILMLVVLTLLLGGTLFHELGHAAGCRYGGGSPGVIGVGVYVIVPAFYTNVTDVYRLGRSGRLRTDLGGVYFNGIAALLFGIGYATTGWAPLLLAAFLMHFEAIQQLLPLVRSDGYFILADLVGVPDLFGRIKPILISLLPWRTPGPRVRELRPATRAVISGWVLVVVPVLGTALFFLVIQTPALVANAIVSVAAQWDAAVTSAQSGAWASVALAGVSIFVVAIPMIGLALFLFQFGTRLAKLAWLGVGRGWSALGRRRAGALLQANS